MNPSGSDPQRLPKGGYHMPMEGYSEMAHDPMEKPGFVKPGGGRNRDEGGKDAMPGFEDLHSYKSTTPLTPRTDHGQGVYPPANKTDGPSIGRER